MEIDFGPLSPKERYKLLSGFIIPRPIAFVTTMGLDGAVNAAPYSFFNVFGSDPALVVLGLGSRPDGSPKDTERNILDTGEFVVNMVDEPLAAAMNDCAVDFPPGVDELAETGLSTEPSREVKPPRIAESPVSFECRHVHSVKFKPGRTIILGEAVWMRARDSVIDGKTLRVVDDAYRPVGRLYADLYAYQSDRFEMTRQTYDEWVAERAEIDD